MLLSVMAMAIPTVVMGLLPTYGMIGVAAPVLLVMLRLIQGLSVGGEYTSSLVFLVEHAPPGRRAFSAVWGAWGASAGTLLGSGVGFFTAMLLTPEQLQSWGWRVPEKTSVPHIHIFWKPPDFLNPQNPHHICASHGTN
jgi:MHS family proline/betaine transporter-like MFS transporter